MSKCEFWLRRVIFLSHVICSDGIGVNPSKIDVMSQGETLKSVTEIRSFIGLVGYYRKFIEVFFEVSIVVDSVSSKGSDICLGCAL